MIAKQLLKALNKMCDSDVKQKRTYGFHYIDSRIVPCGSEHAFQMPIGYSAYDVHEQLDALVAAVGAPVELIDRAGVIILRVVMKDLPRELPVKQDDIASDQILIGYNRLRKPIYHPLNTHILIGGASNSGKTDGVKFWIWQLIQQGYDVRICDLKGFSFFPFESLPNVTIAKSLPEAHDLLVGSISELLQRKERVIRTRNREIIRTFKPVVVVIDEAAALAPKQNNGHAKKLAEECDQAIALFGQQAREPRMFMLYCTQRPSVDVINLQFRANVEAMISFRTRDKENSRLILGREGAEQISPHTPGRCIYLYDRDYTLQVPYVGRDAAWEKLLAPLKTEVLHDGSSRRTGSQRQVIDGALSRSDSDNEATGHTQQQFGSAKESIGAAQGVRGSEDGPGNISRQGEGVAAYTKRAFAAGYTDSID